MNEISSFRKLIAWQKAMDLADAIFDATDAFPQTHRYEIGRQMRKSAVSIPSNIAEGTRYGRRGYIHFVTIALGSHAELDTQCELATRRKLLNGSQARQLTPAIEELGRIMHGLRRALCRRPTRP
jgi:four helix bundle protein